VCSTLTWSTLVLDRVPFPFKLNARTLTRISEPVLWRDRTDMGNTHVVALVKLHVLSSMNSSELEFMNTLYPRILSLTLLTGAVHTICTLNC